MSRRESGGRNTDGNGHTECYGRMFHDVLPFEADRPMKGRVFSFTLETAGGLYRSGRQIDTDLEAWDECRGCSEFDHCYRLSTARLLLEAAVEHAWSFESSSVAGPSYSRHPRESEVGS